MSLKMHVTFNQALKVYRTAIILQRGIFRVILTVIPEVFKSQLIARAILMSHVKYLRHVPNMSRGRKYPHPHHFIVQDRVFYHRATLACAILMLYRTLSLNTLHTSESLFTSGTKRRCIASFKVTSTATVSDRFVGFEKRVVHMRVNGVITNMPLQIVHVYVTITYYVIYTCYVKYPIQKLKIQQHYVEGRGGGGVCRLLFLMIFQKIFCSRTKKGG